MSTALRTPTSTRFRLRIVGTLFLAAFLLYGVGNGVATSADSTALLTLGVGMMLTNSLAVLSIGILMRPVLRPYSPAVATGYLVTRIVEAAFLGGGALALAAGSSALNVVLYNLGMASLGLGSLFFCAVLYRERLVPRFLAVWGFVGYAVFAAGSILELAGVSGVGLIAAAPGGLFEIDFAVWLLVAGFTTRSGQFDPPARLR